MSTRVRSGVEVGGARSRPVVVAAHHVAMRPRSRRPSRPSARPLAVLAVTMVLAACGGDDPADDAVDELAPPANPLESLSEQPPGQGVAVIGIEELSFTVTECADGPGPDDTPEATTELRIEGDGETGEEAFRVEAVRYRSDTGVGDPVITETVRFVFGTEDDARGLQAKRSTAGADGAWLDLADPDATGPLIERTDDSVDVRASFGPEGAVAGAEGIVTGRVRFTCPD